MPKYGEQFTELERFLKAFQLLQQEEQQYQKNQAKQRELKRKIMLEDAILKQTQEELGALQKAKESIEAVSNSRKQSLDKEEDKYQECARERDNRNRCRSELNTSIISTYKLLNSDVRNIAATDEEIRFLNVEIANAKDIVGKTTERIFGDSRIKGFVKNGKTYVSHQECFGDSNRHPDMDFWNCCGTGCFYVNGVRELVKKCLSADPPRFDWSFDQIESAMSEFRHSWPDHQKDLLNVPEVAGEKYASVKEESDKCVARLESQKARAEKRLKDLESKAHDKVRLIQQHELSFSRTFWGKQTNQAGLEGRHAAGNEELLVFKERALSKFSVVDGIRTKPCFDAWDDVISSATRWTEECIERAERREQIAQDKLEELRDSLRGTEDVLKRRKEDESDTYLLLNSIISELFKDLALCPLTFVDSEDGPAMLEKMCQKALLELDKMNASFRVTLENAGKSANLEHDRDSYDKALKKFLEPRPASYSHDAEWKFRQANLRMFLSKTYSMACKDDIMKVYRKAFPSYAFQFLNDRTSTILQAVLEQDDGQIPDEFQDTYFFPARLARVDVGTCFFLRREMTRSKCCSLGTILRQYVKHMQDQMFGDSDCRKDSFEFKFQRDEEKHHFEDTHRKSMAVPFMAALQAKVHDIEAHVRGTEFDFFTRIGVGCPFDCVQLRRVLAETNDKTSTVLVELCPEDQGSRLPSLAELRIVKKEDKSADSVVQVVHFAAEEDVKWELSAFVEECCPQQTKHQDMLKTCLTQDFRGRRSIDQRLLLQPEATQEDRCQILLGLARKLGKKRLQESLECEQTASKLFDVLQSSFQQVHTLELAGLGYGFSSLLKAIINEFLDKEVSDLRTIRRRMRDAASPELEQLLWMRDHTVKSEKEMDDEEESDERLWQVGLEWPLSDDDVKVLWSPTKTLRSEWRAMMADQVELLDDLVDRLRRLNNEPLPEADQSLAAHSASRFSRHCQQEAGQPSVCFHCSCWIPDVQGASSGI